MSKPKAETISVVELLAMFSTEGKARKWLESARWGGKPVCPKCGGTDGIKRRRGAGHQHSYHCNPCRYKFTATTSTVMHGSKLGVKLWAVAFYFVLTSRKGVSSLQLSKELGITQKSAWFMLQRIREACASGDFKLSNSVEVDETYIGGKERNRHASKRKRMGRGGAGKQAVIGARERGGKVKAAPIADTGKATIHQFIGDSVEVGATIYSDEAGAYSDLDSLLYKHGAVNHGAREYVKGMAHTNGIESVWALLKRGINGTYHNISVKHLARYVNEFSFRLNEGNCAIDTIDRMRFLIQAAAGRAITYKELTR